VLYGDPTKPGLFVSRVKFSAGWKDSPHWHPDEVRTVVVLSGTLFFGSGDKRDESKFRAYPAGTFYSEPPKAPHFTWAKDGEVRGAAKIECGVAAFARSSNGGLIVTGSALAVVHHEVIVAAAARHKLPALTSNDFFVAAGGLIFMGPISSTSSDRRLATSIASSRGRSRPTCPCRRRLSTN
jgi:hypothetical protein